jgi:small subunit ribosomal protein S3
MARKETQKLGSIPLHTLVANVDYAVATSRTTYGSIGIKVWIYKGKFGEEDEQSYHHRRRRPTRRVTSGPGEARKDAAQSKDQKAVKTEEAASPTKEKKSESD